MDERLFTEVEINDKLARYGEAQNADSGILHHNAEGNQKIEKIGLKNEDNKLKDDKFFQSFKIDAKNLQNVTEIPDELKPVLSKLLRRSFETESTIPCEYGYFRMDGMEKCQPWLGCEEIKDKNILKEGNVLGGGIGKIAHSGLLYDKYVLAIVKNRNLPKQTNRVMVGNRNLLMLQPSPYALQVIGYCEEPPNSTILTESCEKCMDLAKLHRRNYHSYRGFSDLQRFEWATKIVGAFDYLHHGLGLPRVHCDLHTRTEAMTQFIVTKDLSVFMSDVDELPQVDKENGVFPTCKEELNGIMKKPYFIAPEQRYTLEEYKKYKSRKPVDEKSDIWKIPDITKKLIERSKMEKFLMKKLEFIHQKCKNLDPKLRPTARDVFIEYLKVLKEFQT
ncbi:protein O-mannose kinase-like [Styela clava]